MSVNRGLIQNDKYFTQVGVLTHMGRSSFGDNTIVSTETVKLLVYQESNREVQSTPEIGKRIEHFACIPTSVTVQDGDQLSNVVDRFGSAVLTAARIVKVTEYGDFRHGSRFRKLDLDLDLV